jgi:hypothetical protein
MTVRDMVAAVAVALMVDMTSSLIVFYAFTMFA